MPVVLLGGLKINFDGAELIQTELIQTEDAVEKRDSGVREGTDVSGATSSLPQFGSNTKKLNHDRHSKLQRKTYQYTWR